MSCRYRSKGWSLIEVLVAAAIIALLITLSFPAFAFVKAKMNFAACVGNLRAIHAGLSLHLQDHAMVWPQPPQEALESEDEREDQLSIWWFEALKPYSVTRKTWLCPGDRDGNELDQEDMSTFLASYGVTLFDETPNNAYRWFQPWVIESGQNHGKGQGPNLIMPDGEVRQGIGIDIIPPEQ
jgi:prepilin-type N-terminal cleavage/methylation domain-containing protein